jgi:hypothetical protein
MKREAPGGQECPHCGAEVAAGRLACPECGSDAATGWKSSEEIDYQAVELPDAEPPPPRRRPALFTWTLVLLVLAFAIAAVAW